MDYFNDVLNTFLGLERVSCVTVYEMSESSRISSKNSLICVQKINEGFFLIFLGELSLYVS